MEFELLNREETGSNACKQLRRQGLIPGIVYGGEKSPVSISIDAKSVEIFIRRHEHTVDVSLDGERATLLLKDLQYDCLGDHILHLDFKRVAADEVVEVPV